MNPRLLFPSASAAVLLLVGTSARADDFKPLFNGEDLSGWVQPEDKSIWSVEDGEIVGKTKQGQLKKNEFLVTDRPYRNFVLKAKVKILNGNSGIQFHSKREENGAVAGPQVDIADGYWGVLYDERGKRGIIERYDPEKAKELAKKGDWNAFEVSMKDNHLVVHLNGTKILDRQDDQFPEDGIIALQVHAGPPMEVRFKDLEIKPLD
jgi:hypothetical protein